MIGLDTNVVVRYLAQDDQAQTAIATRLMESTLTAEAPGYLSIVTVAEIVWVMVSNYRAKRDAVAHVVEGLLSAPQLTIESADVIWRAIRAYRDSTADFSDALIGELGREAGCSKTFTFDKKASTLPGFAPL